ncbi:hypothetical protein NO373_17140 [Escherichia coli]|nr:hypothetical protein [Escherichia coli]
MINLLLFHAINALLAVFQANKQIRGFTRRIGMFIVRVIPEVWPSG